MEKSIEEIKLKFYMLEDLMSCIQEAAASGNVEAEKFEGAICIVNNYLKAANNELDHFQMQKRMEGIEL